MGPLSSTSHLSLPTWGHLATLPRPVPPPGLHTFLWPHPAHQAWGPHSSFRAQTRFSKACSRLTTVPCTPAWVRLAGPLSTAPRNCSSRSGQQGLQLTGIPGKGSPVEEQLQQAQPSWASKDKPASWGSNRDSVRNINIHVNTGPW